MRAHGRTFADMRFWVVLRRALRWQPSGWRGVLGQSFLVVLPVTVLAWRVVNDLSWPGALLMGLLFSVVWAGIAAWEVRHPRQQRRRRSPWPQDVAPPARRD